MTETATDEREGLTGIALSVDDAGLVTMAIGDVEDDGDRRPDEPRRDRAPPRRPRPGPHLPTQEYTPVTDEPPRRPILCVDFDGVLHAYTSPWSGPAVVADGPVPGAVAFLASAVERFRVCVYSSRSETPEGIEAMRVALGEWIHAEMGEAGLRVYAGLEFPTTKPPALVTLDDRAVRFDGVWPDLGALLSLRPWNKHESGPLYARDRARFLEHACLPVVVLDAETHSMHVLEESGRVEVRVPLNLVANFISWVGNYALVQRPGLPRRLAQIEEVRALGAEDPDGALVVAFFPSYRRGDEHDYPEDALASLFSPI